MIFNYIELINISRDNAKAARIYSNIQQDILGFFFLDIPVSLASPFQAFLSSALQVPLSSSFYISVSLPLLLFLFPDSQIARQLDYFLVFLQELLQYTIEKEVRIQRREGLQRYRYRYRRRVYIVSAFLQPLQAAIVYTRLETALRLLHIVSYRRYITIERYLEVKKILRDKKKGALG